MKTYLQVLQAVREILASSNELVQRGSIDSEAEQLLLASCQREGARLGRLELYSNIHQTFPSEKAWHLLTQWAQARAKGEPLQYLTGFQTFLEHDYQVGPGVLIPRPETEILIERAKKFLSQLPGGPKLGLEVGLGSGVLSIELLCAFPGLQMVATEISQDALRYARQNFSQIIGSPLENTPSFRLLNVKDPLSVIDPFSKVIPQSSADFLITNPPYLTGDKEVEAQVFQYEPHLALFAPVQDPLYFYRKTAQDAGKYLKPNGFVFAEIPHERSQEILSIFSNSNWEGKLFKDLNDRERVLVARSTGEKNG